MRGDDPRHESMFSYVTPERGSDHPLQPIRRMTAAALARLSARFDHLYATTGRPSIPPAQLLRAAAQVMTFLLGPTMRRHVSICSSGAGAGDDSRSL